METLNVYSPTSTSMALSPRQQQMEYETKSNKSINNKNQNESKNHAIILKEIIETNDNLKSHLQCKLSLNF